MKHHVSMSATFLMTHKRAGAKTNFFAKLQKYIEIAQKEEVEKYIAAHGEIGSTTESKCSTIRENGRINIGDEMAFFTWAGQPRRMTQVDGYIEKIGRIKLGSAICISKKTVSIYPTERKVILNDAILDNDGLIILYKEEGLSEQDFWDWFKEPFCGFQYIFKKKLEAHQRDAILFFPVFAMALIAIFKVAGQEAMNTNLRYQFAKQQLTKAQFAKTNFIIENEAQISALASAILKRHHKGGILQTFFQIAFEMEQCYNEIKNTLRVKNPEAFKNVAFHCYTTNELFRLKDKFRFVKDEDLEKYHNEIKKSCVFS